MFRIIYASGPNAVPAGAMAPVKTFFGVRVFTERGYNE
jgi:hypothetical protein